MSSKKEAEEVVELPEDDLDKVSGGIAAVGSWNIVKNTTPTGETILDIPK